MKPSSDTVLRVALAGFGAIGRAVGDRLNEGIPGLSLSAVAVRDRDKARRHMADYSHQPDLVALEELAAHVDIGVECAPAAVFAQIAEAAVGAGRVFMPVSVGVLLTRPDLIDLATQTGARIIVPTGALIGLDAVRAAAQGTIK